MPEPEDRDEALGRYVDALLGGADADAPADDAATRCREAAEALKQALAEDLPSDEPPALPPDYELLGELGRGGMGVVYKVRQKSLDRLLALKVLRPDERLFEEAVRRFQREARSLARLRHRHIVSIHEVGEAERRVYFTMDLIEGATLAELLRRNEVTPTRAVRIVRQVASAIGYAHAQGVVHRDLKPGNILVDAQGDAYVVDFGLARDLSGPGDVTASGYLLGTPAYMAPEQARGDAARVGEATDVYALGVVLYEAITRRAPFGGKAVAQTLHDVLHREPRPPRRLNPKVPRDLEVICLKAVAKEPERRYPTMRAFLEDLERFESGRPILARPPSLPYRAVRFVRRHRGAVAAVAAAVVLAAGVFLAVVRPYLGQSPENLFSTAESLHEAGEHAAAVVLLDRALRKSATGPAAQRILSALARCRVETADARPPEKAVEELDALIAHGKRLYGDPFDDGWPEEGDVLWSLANAQLRAGRREEALATFGRAKEALSEKRERGAGFMASLGQAFKTDVYAEGMNRLLPALLDAAHPGHEAAIAFLTNELGDVFDHDAVEWLDGLGERCLPIVVDAVAVAAAGADRDRFGEVAEAAQTLFRLHPGRALEERLAAAMEDPARPGDAKAVYHRALLEAADLPFGFHWNLDGGFVPADTPSLRAAALSHWREVRELPRAERLTRGVAEAIRVLETDPKQKGAAADWLVAHSGFDPGTGTTAVYDPGRWKTWMAAHGAEAPAARLARAVGLDPSRIPPPAELLELFLRASGTRRAWLHHLLALSLPETTAVPRRPSLPYEPKELAMEWRRVLAGAVDDTPYVLHAIGLAWKDGRAEPDVLWTDVRPIRVGRPETIERTIVREEPGAMQAGLLVPGLGHRGVARPMRTTHLSAGARLDWESKGLVLEFGAGGRVSVSGGSRVSSGGGGREALQGLITPDTHVWEKSFGAEGPSPSLELALAVALPPGSDPRPWTLGDWRRTLAENLRTLADGLATDAGKREAPFFYKYQQSVWLLPRVAAVLAVPDAAEALRRIEAHLMKLDHGDSAKQALPLARLRSGDPAPFEAPDADERLAKALDDDFDPAAAWARLALGSPDGPVRAGALERLAKADEIHPAVAATLAEAAREGRLTLPPATAARVRSAPQSPWAERLEAAWFYFALAAAVGLFALAALAQAFRGARARVRLVAAGLLVVAFYLTVEGHDVLPDALGYALAALGTGLLARGGTGASRRVSPTAFALAALLDGAGRLGAWPGVLLPLSGPAAGLALAATPFLARALDPRIRWPWLSFAIWGGAVGVTAVGSLPGEPLGNVQLSGGWAAAVLVVMIGSIAGLLRTLRSAAISATAESRPRAG